MQKKYIPVIGLEVHVELSTESKMFCGCPAGWFGKEPNSQTCPVCLGLPGALPVPNKKAIDWAILLGLALNCSVAKTSKFDRKHYFYPDLPKGYQISQYDEPFCKSGNYKLSAFVQTSAYKQVTSSKGPGTKTIGITRVHLEEDTGRLLHKGSDTLIDFNRSGVPLVEIVTEPDFENSGEVKEFLEELQVLVRYLGISDADMEKGSMRLEPNISLMKSPRDKSQETNKSQLPNYKVEVKNINSFRFAKRAIEYELKRQAKIFDRGETPRQETRGYDEHKGVTVGQRTKEEAQDYRYFPEPDIPPMSFSDKEVAEIQKQIPEMPWEKVERYSANMGVKRSDSFILSRDLKQAAYFESIVKKARDIKPNKIASLIVNKKISTDISVEKFIEAAKARLAPKATDERALATAIDKVIKENVRAVRDFKSGKENVLMFLVGQVMRELKGEADASKVAEFIKARI